MKIKNLVERFLRFFQVFPMAATQGLRLRDGEVYWIDGDRYRLDGVCDYENQKYRYSLVRLPPLPPDLGEHKK